MVLDKNKNNDEMDSLTNTLSKTSILNKAKVLVENKKPFSLIFLDFDNFKNINDSLGHQIGDEALRLVSKEILKNCGDKALVGRFGGDEFIIVVEDIVDYNEIWNFCSVLTSSIRENVSISEIEETAPAGRITVTAGVSRFPKDADKIEELLKIADLALYRGKAKGKNCFIIYNKDLHSNITILAQAKFISLPNIINFVFSELSDPNKTPDQSLNKIMTFIGNYYGISMISKTKENRFEILFTDNSISNPSYIPLDLYEVLAEDDAICTLYYYNKLKNINADLAEYFVKQRYVFSSILIKVRTKSNLYGYIRVDGRHERIWTEDEKLLFQVIGNLYAYVLETKNYKF